MQLKIVWPIHHQASVPVIGNFWRGRKLIWRQSIGCNRDLVRRGSVIIGERCGRLTRGEQGECKQDGGEPGASVLAGE